MFLPTMLNVLKILIMRELRGKGFSSAYAAYRANQDTVLGGR